MYGNPTIGCNYPGYPNYAPGYPGGVAIVGAAPPAYPMVGYQGPVTWDIVGQTPIGPGGTAPPKTMLDKVKDFGNEETFGVKNSYIGAAAVVTAGIWALYAHGTFGR